MKNWLSIILLFVTINVHSQSDLSHDWYLQASDSTSYLSIDVDNAYTTLLKNLQPSPVIVAVLDTGLETDHEDIVDRVWVNTREIPDNGIDDDQNGYIDDINGWNFLGNEKGEILYKDSKVEARIYAKYDYKYHDAKMGALNKYDKKEYDLYIKARRILEAEREAAQTSLAELEESSYAVHLLLDIVENALDTNELNLENLNTLKKLDDEKTNIAISFLEELYSINGYLPSLEELSELLLDDLETEAKGYKDQLEFRYNPDYDPRELIGDDYANMNDRIYGNAIVNTSGSFHGNHVSGTIIANRNNDIGIKGIANDMVKVMAVRTLANGDERDKDVANAIRYAVDNGASVINMSFGKNFSLHKQTVDDAVRYAEKNDVLIVHGSGNDGRDTDQTPCYPNDKFVKPKGFLFWRKKEASNWIEVGASSYSNDENAVAQFSNYGQKSVDVFAPGVYIYSTALDNEYRIAQGTSMASPMVSGLAAVLRSYFPTLSAKQVKEVIMKSGKPLNHDVYRPNSDELVPLSTLSVSGRIINMKNAIELALKTKGKKKLKKPKSKV